MSYQGPAQNNINKLAIEEDEKQYVVDDSNAYMNHNYNMSSHQNLNADPRLIHQQNFNNYPNAMQITYMQQQQLQTKHNTNFPGQYLNPLPVSMNSHQLQPQSSHNYNQNNNIMGGNPSFQSYQRLWSW